MLKGGILLSNDQEVFSFELNEVLFFEKGQEVAEMRGISLDPEISIQTFNEYISIRGVIELNGDYQRIPSTGEEDEIIDFEDIHSKRYVEKVVATEDNGAAFTHRFPVEISVPKYRVTDFNDVTVNIESFDYEIVEPSQLKLYSTVEIHGINQEVEAPRDDLEEEKETEVDSEPQEEERETGDEFQFEVKQKQEKESADEVELMNHGHPPALPAEVEREAETVEEKEDPDRWKYTQSQTLKDFFKKLPSQEAEVVSPEVVDTPSSSALEAMVSPESYEFSSESDVMVSPELFEYSRESIASPEPIESKESVEDVRYLSDMFRNSEEHQYTQMRLCIVQNHDTIETIAERYHVSTLQLIKENRLNEDFSISEGQLLYIPDQRK